jgi:hypothetical protein
MATSGYHYTPEKRLERLARRVRLSNGHWFHPDAPTHGTWTGWNYWECRCLVCRDRGRRAYEAAKARRLHNRRILAESSIFRAPVDTAPTTGSSTRPAPASGSPTVGATGTRAGART